MYFLVPDRITTRFTDVMYVYTSPITCLSNTLRQRRNQFTTVRRIDLIGNRSGTRIRRMCHVEGNKILEPNSRRVGQDEAVIAMGSTTLCQNLFESNQYTTFLVNSIGSTFRVVLGFEI
jgi:hypothetical protein